MNRWTMEVTNNSRYYSIPLVVGRRIAQIVFLATDGVLSGAAGGGQGSYERAGKYQSSDQLAVVQRDWRPSDMLPKMYLDRECRQSALRGASTDGDESSAQQQQQRA